MNTEAMCTVCKKFVEKSDQDEHLKTNHLGPHYFWFEAKRYKTNSPSMHVFELCQLVGEKLGPCRTFVEDRSGAKPGYDWIYHNDVDCLDLTREPHFFILLAATYYRH